MSNDANLSGFQKDRYFGRAWAMLTREKGWWKPVLLCALGALVPIVGPLAVLGYGLEWSRRVAWGSTEGPSRQVKIGGLIKSGWRGFVVVAGWSIAAGVVGTIVGNLPWIGDLLGSVWWIFSLFLNVAFLVAAVRATIYQSFKAGYRAKTLWQMVSRDPWGLVKIFVINLVAGLIVGVVTIMVFMPALFGSLGFIVDLVDYMDGYYYYMTEAEEMRLALEVLGFFVQQFAPAFFATLLVSLVAGSFVGLLINCGVGLWLRQFDVPAWGKDEGPLPETSVGETSVSELPASPVAEPPAPVAPVAPVSPSPEPTATVAPAAPVSAADEQAAAEPVPAASEPAPSSADAKKTCVACGSELPENAKFCVECGAAVPAPAAEAAPEPAPASEAPAEDAAVAAAEPDEPPVPGDEDEKDEDADDDSGVIMVTPIAVAPVDVLSQNREDIQQQPADMQSAPTETGEEQ